MHDALASRAFPLCAEGSRLLERARSLTQLVHDLADLSGGSAHFRSHPLQRAVRDVRTASAHVLFDLDARLASYGRALLGLDPGGFS